jgi:hypothetical protein
MSLSCPENPTPFIEPTLFTKTCLWTLYWVKISYKVQNIKSRYYKTQLQSRSKTCEKRPLASSCLSACPSVRMNNSAPTRHIFMIFDISGFLENPSRMREFRQSLTRITVLYMKTDMCTFMISPWTLRAVRNGWDKRRENQNAYFMFSVSSLRPPPPPQPKIMLFMK